MTLFLILIITS